MNNLLLFLMEYKLVEYVIVGFLCISVGASIGQILASLGIIRDKSLGLLGTISFFSYILLRLGFPQISWFVVMLVSSLAPPLGLYRADIWTTMQQGTWWWRKP